MGQIFLQKIIDPFNNGFIELIKLREILDNIMSVEDQNIYTDSICKYFRR